MLKTGSSVLRGLSHELHIAQVHGSMLLLSLIVSVTVVDPGAVHVGVTVTMATAAVIASGS